MYDIICHGISYLVIPHLFNIILISIVILIPSVLFSFITAKGDVKK